MKTGLVLEGGAFRGVFTSGVIDILLKADIPFDYCVGVSAGAGNAMHFKSRQPGRALALTAGEESESYYGLSQVRKNGTLLDLDYLYQTLSYGGAYPFDFAAYYRNPMTCEYVVTDLTTGQAAYLHETVYQKRLLAIVQASCSIPGLCHPVTVDGVPYLDGGIADSLPVFRALAQGCGRVVLVTTKPANDLHPTDYTRLRPLMQRLYGRRYPAFYAALMTRAKRYFAQLDEILALEREGRILVIRPEACPLRGMEKNREKMLAYYRHGCDIAQQQLPALRAYLS